MREQYWLAGLSKLGVSFGCTQPKCHDSADIVRMNMGKDILSKKKHAIRKVTD
jgi:hypothetical protein